MATDHGAIAADLQLSVRSRVFFGFARWLRPFRPLASAAASAGARDLPPCRLEMPETDIVKNYDTNGNIVFQCLHSTAHCWDLAGRVASCR